ITLPPVSKMTASCITAVLEKKASRLPLLMVRFGVRKWILFLRWSVGNKHLVYDRLSVFGKGKCGKGFSRRIRLFSFDKENEAPKFVASIFNRLFSRLYPVNHKHIDANPVLDRI